MRKNGDDHGYYTGYGRLIDLCHCRVYVDQGYCFTGNVNFINANFNSVRMHLEKFRNDDIEWR